MNSSILFIDDDARMRRAISRLLSTYGYDVKTFASAKEFLAGDIPSAPACLILDLKMPEVSGLDVQQILTQGDSCLAIIFVSGQADVSSTILAMKGGAIDFLIKPFDDSQLIAAIEMALTRSRKTYKEREALKEDRKAFEKLTPRERDVCVRIARGLLNKQVGFELGTAEKTVKAQRARVMQKLGAESLADVVRLVERLRTEGISPN